MLEPVKLVLHLILGHEMYFYSKNLLPTYNSIVLGIPLLQTRCCTMTF